MKLMSYIFIAVLWSGTFTGCQSGELRRQGKEEVVSDSETQYLNKYNFIAFRGNFDIFIDDHSTSLDSLLRGSGREALEYQFVQDTLVVINKKSLRSSLKCSIRENVNFMIYDHVRMEYAKTISSYFTLKSYDSSKCFVVRIKGGRIIIEAHNASSIQLLASQSPRIDIKTSGNSIINAEHLLFDTAYIETHSKGIISLNCKDYLEARGSGIGEIKYIGTPKISNQLKYSKKLTSF